MANSLMDFLLQLGILPSSLCSINPDPNEQISFCILLTGDKSLQHFSVHLAEILAVAASAGKWGAVVIEL